LFLNFALVYTIKNVQENQKRLELNGTRQLTFSTDDVNIYGEDIDDMM